MQVISVSLSVLSSNLTFSPDPYPFSSLIYEQTTCEWASTDNTTTQGGRSMMGFGGAQAALSDVVNLYSVAEKSYKISELVSVTDGPFCYTYA